MKMAVIGAGYVGSVTGTCLAELGHDVVCTDVNEARIKKLQEGISPFYEEGLEPLIRSNMEAGRLSFTTNIKEAVSNADVIFLCMGAKTQTNTSKPDLTPITQAIKDIASCLTDGKYRLIVEKSTLPVKTGEWLTDLLSSQMPAGTEASFDLAAVPQFMREGNAVEDFMHPDRIIIGAANQKAIDALVSIYQPLSSVIFITDINSAELIKHATNAYLAMKISFINSIGQLCEKTGADVTMVSKGLGMDKRIGLDFLNAGLGYGGIFLPKDIAALLAIAEEYHVNLDLLKQTEVVNRYQRINFIERIEEVTGDLHGKTVAIWGLAFRPNTDDMRDAPSLVVVRGLQKRGAKIRAYDPLAMEPCREHLPDITYCKDPYDAAKGADAIAVLTEWQEFSNMNFTQLKETSECRTIIDGRNLFQPQRMSQLGFRYVSVGRKIAEPEVADDKKKVTV